mmetsp:Transcript_50218/g.120905  ORF Transcript_50218/g.120905 Transcript_50218/m.120905 type:complete len:155 (+) Transcript_50218:1-465(+)
MPAGGEPMMHIEPPEISIGVEEPPPSARTVEQLPGPQQQEWAAGPAHWAAIIAAGFAVWRYALRGGGAVVHRTGGAAAGQRPDADELRRKRLEALQRTSPAPAASPSPTGGDGEGLKRRSVGGGEGSPPEVERKMPAEAQEPSAAAAAASPAKP